LSHPSTEKEIEFVAVWGGDEESVTLMEKLNPHTEFVGLPLSTPPELRVTPGGRMPVALHVSGPVPLAAVSCTE
jgi:hypothetical protein